MLSDNGHSYLKRNVFSMFMDFQRESIIFLSFFFYTFVTFDKVLVSLIFFFFLHYIKRFYSLRFPSV